MPRSVLVQLTDKTFLGHSQGTTNLKDISIGIDCLVRIQTDVLKGSNTQAERTCQTFSAKSFALKAFNQECFPLRSCFDNTELGQELWKDNHQNDGPQFQIYDL
jgi:hypothetical protein